MIDRYRHLAVGARHLDSGVREPAIEQFYCVLKAADAGRELR